MPDFDDWSLTAIVARAQQMEARHGRQEARRNALDYRRCYWPSMWGFQHWQLVAELLEGTRTAAEILDFPVPAPGWPTKPTAAAPAIPPLNAWKPWWTIARDTEGQPVRMTLSGVGGTATRPPKAEKPETPPAASEPEQGSLF